MKDYKKSLGNYEKAFSISDTVILQDYYNAACVSAMQGNSAAAFNYLKIISDKGYKDVIWIMKDEDLSTLHKEKQWNDIIDQIKMNYREYEKQFDKGLRDQILKMIDTDQELRKSWGIIENKFGKHSSQYDSMQVIIDQARAIHSEELKKLYSEKGFPGHHVIGKDGLYNIWVLSLHALDVEFQKLTLLYLIIEASNGGIEWEQIAMLTDRIAFNEKKAQFFGTRFEVVNWDKRQIKLYQVSDIHNLDKRRISIGLKPVQEAYAKWGYELLELPEQNK